MCDKKSVLHAGLDKWRSVLAGAHAMNAMNGEGILSMMNVSETFIEVLIILYCMVMQVLLHCIILFCVQDIHVLASIFFAQFNSN